MNHSRPAYTLTTLLVLLSMILTACQSNSPAPSQSTKTVTATQATAEPTSTARPQVSATPLPTPTPPPHLAFDVAELRGVQVNFWHPWRGDLAVRAEEAVNQFNKENTWGITVQVRAMPSSPALYEAVDTQGTGTPAGDAVNVVAAAPEELAAWLAAGRLMPLDDYLSHGEWGMSEEEKSTYNPVFWQQDQWAGEEGLQQFGIPAVRSARVLIYNETWANDLGFQKPPATPDEFREQVCAAAQSNNLAPESSKHFTGGWLIDTEALVILSWLDAFNAQVLPAADGAPYTFDTEEAAKTTSFLRKLFDDGCAWEGRSPTPHEYFANRMALIYSGTLQDLAIQAATQQRLNSGDRWVAIPYPMKVDAPGSVFSYGYSYGVMVGTPQQQLASWLFVRWLAKPRNQALLAEVWPSLPVTSTSALELADYKNHFPWSMIFPLETALKPAPNLPSWRKVRVILEDAALIQLFRLPVDQLQYFLPELDATTREVLLQEQIDR